MKKKLLSILLGVSMVLSMLSGCSSETETASQDETASGSTEEAESSGNSQYEDFITVDVFDELANYQGIATGWFADIVKEKFNMELNIIAPNIAGGGDTLFQTRSAAGDLGDLIIMGGDSGRLQDVMTADLILDMSDYLSDAQYVTQYDSAIDTINGLVDTDGFWAAPTSVSSQSVTTPSEGLDLTYGPYLRWDYYKELGYPDIATLEDLLPVLQEMQEAHPTSDSGKQTYALSLFKDWDGNMMNDAKQPACYYGYDALGFVLAKADGSDYQSIIDSDSMYVRALKFFYEANQMGLVDPESTTQNYDTMYAKYQDGQIFFSFWPWLGQAAYNTTEHEEAGQGFMLAAIDDMQIFSYGCAVNGEKTGISIGSKAEDPQRLADFIDWLYSPEGVMVSCAQTLGSCGPEGLTWEIQDSQPVLTDFGKEALLDGDATVPDEWGGGSWKDGVSPLNVTTVLTTDINPDTGVTYDYTQWDSVLDDEKTVLDEDWQEHMDASTTTEYLENANQMIVAPGSGYAAPQEDSEITTIRSQCKEIIVQNSWQMIFAADEEEFNSLLEEMQNTVIGLGYDQVLEVDMQNAKDQEAAREQAVADEEANAGSSDTESTETSTE